MCVLCTGVGKTLSRHSKQRPPLLAASIASHSLTPQSPTTVYNHLRLLQLETFMLQPSPSTSKCHKKNSYTCTYQVFTTFVATLSNCSYICVSRNHSANILSPSFCNISFFALHKLPQSDAAHRLLLSLSPRISLKVHLWQNGYVYELDVMDKNLAVATLENSSIIAIYKKV